jgi:hypothetical protein
MARKTPPTLQLGHESLGSVACRGSMPITLATKRAVQSAKETRVRPTHASAHHMRQVAKLKEAVASSVAKPSPTVDPLSIQKQLFQASAKIKLPPSPGPLLSPTTTNLQTRPQSSSAFKARKIERTRFRYFCGSLYLTAASQKILVEH